jgi:flagellar basal body P-ring formation protein FlgA
LLKAVLFFILSSTIGVSAAFADATPVIQVHDKVELEMEHQITIGDIADFSGFNDNELGEIRSVRLSDAPSVGESRTFTNVGLSQIFRRHIPRLQNGRNEKITLLIPSVVTVKRKTFRLEAKTIEADLQKQWATLCAVCEFRISQMTAPILPAGLSPESKWQVRIRPEMPRGSFSVPLEVTSPDMRRTFWISGTVTAYRQVPVAKRTIQPGERFTPNDFALEKKDVTFTTDGIPTESEITAAIAARVISADQIVGRSMLRREQALKMGEPVKIVTGQEGWQISIEGVAQQSGYIGDMVRVKVPRTQKVLSGLLREKGVVEVQ